MRSTAWRKASGSLSKVVMSLKRMPSLGKLGTARILARSACSAASSASSASSTGRQSSRARQSAPAVPGSLTPSAKQAGADHGPFSRRERPERHDRDQVDRCGNRDHRQHGNYPDEKEDGSPAQGSADQNAPDASERSQPVPVAPQEPPPAQKEGELGQGRGGGRPKVAETRYQCEVEGQVDQQAEARQPREVGL